jgi:O-antigen/teichoic acid export membrane protein
MAPESTPGSLEVDLGKPPVDLTTTVVSGVRWKSLTRVVSVATRLIVSVVVARLLTPTEYGIAGMAFVAASFGFLFTDPALGAALIQRPAIDERDRSTVFWLASGIGLLLTVLGVALSGLIADFFGEAQVQELFAVCSLCFVLVSLSVAPRALLARKLAYRSLEIREMVGIVAGGAAAIGVAFAGFGPWAVVMNLVASTLVSTALVWILVDWRPQATFSRESARNLGGFSGRVFAASALSWGDLNLDKALVGRFLGAQALGPYSLAFGAMLLPQQMLGRPLNEVLSPAFSRIQSDTERLERAWLRSKRLSVAVVAPAVLSLVVLAPDFVPVVFGAQWNEAVLPLQLLCIGGVAASLVNLHWAVLLARGEGSTLFRLTLWSSVVRWAAILVGLPWGIVGVAASYAGVRWLLVVPSTWFTTRGVSFRFWPALRAGAGMLPAAVAAAAAGFAVRQLLLQTSTPQAARLIVAAGVILVSYLAIVLVTTPSIMREMMRMFRNRPTT